MQDAMHAPFVPELGDQAYCPNAGAPVLRQSQQFEISEAHLVAPHPSIPHPVSQYPMDPNQVQPDLARQEEQDVEEPQELSVSVAVVVERWTAVATRARIIRMFP